MDRSASDETAERPGKAPLLTGEELEAIKATVLLTLVLDVLEHDIRTLRTLQLKMPAVYVGSLRRVQDRVTAELSGLRRRLRAGGLKIYMQERSRTGMDVRYLCRGYDHRLTLLWGLVKAEVKTKLCGYLELDVSALTDRNEG